MPTSWGTRTPAENEGIDLLREVYAAIGDPRRELGTDLDDRVRASLRMRPVASPKEEAT